MTRRTEEEKKALHALLANVAVQIRGPLSVMHMALEKVQKPYDLDTARLNQAYYQLLRLAGNLSAAELLGEEGLALLPLRNGDIVAFLRALNGRIRPLAEDRGITLRLEVPMEEHLVAYNEEALERLVLNLLSNALKFTEPGGTVTLSLRRTEQDLLLTVADTGCGMAPEKLEQLFDRYLHSEAMDPVPHGLGLGLPICRAIAEAHGGRIFAESQVGVGTKVIVALPDRVSMEQILRAPRFDYTGGFDHILVELSDALGEKAYQAEDD